MISYSLSISVQLQPIEKTKKPSHGFVQRDTYARAAARACDLSAELGRRAQRLAEVAPKLRAKGAGSALQALLDEDCLSAATPITGLSERGARRLFERLVALVAIRELTGRKTFRLYGL